MLSGYCDPWSYLYTADANGPAQGAADAAFGSSVDDTAAAAAPTSLELAESGTAADVRVDLRDEIPPASTDGSDAGGKLIQIEGGFRFENEHIAALGASGKSFMPVRGFPTVGLKMVDGEPLMLTSGRWYYEVTMGHGHPSFGGLGPRFGWRDEQRTSWVVDGISEEMAIYGED